MYGNHGVWIVRELHGKRVSCKLVCPTGQWPNNSSLSAEFMNEKEVASRWDRDQRFVMCCLFHS